MSSDADKPGKSASSNGSSRDTTAGADTSPRAVPKADEPTAVNGEAATPATERQRAGAARRKGGQPAGAKRSPEKKPTEPSDGQVEKTATPKAGTPGTGGDRAPSGKDKARDPEAAQEPAAAESRGTHRPSDAEARRPSRIGPPLLVLLMVFAAGLGWLYWDMQGAPKQDGAEVAMASEELRELEQLLSRLDLAPGEVDGVVDDKTRAAVRQFQEFAGLPIDGEPSPELLEELREVAGMM